MLLSKFCISPLWRSNLCSRSSTARVRRTYSCYLESSLDLMSSTSSLLMWMNSSLLFNSRMRESSSKFFKSNSFLFFKTWVSISLSSNCLLLSSFKRSLACCFSCEVSCFRLVKLSISPLSKTRSCSSSVLSMRNLRSSCLRPSLKLTCELERLCSLSSLFCSSRLPLRTCMSNWWRSDSSSSWSSFSFLKSAFNSLSFNFRACSRLLSDSACPRGSLLFTLLPCFFELSSNSFCFNSEWKLSKNFCLSFNSVSLSLTEVNLESSFSLFFF
mmetsp:Transcript_114311/g.245815  ORF Transcript_114311/g.245815 Transcript_114311/m.245815 type:complete len:271 (+) Transcript_114311:420-1232(+)